MSSKQRLVCNVFFTLHFHGTVSGTKQDLNITINSYLVHCREKRQSRNSAIKVLDYAMTGPEGADLCQKFVDILGLRTVFPIFMKTPKVSWNKVKGY